MRRCLLAAVLILAAAPLVATEAIVLTMIPRGVAPEGGAVVTLRSNGVRFDNPTAIYFDKIAVTHFELIDVYTLQVVAPKHEPGLVWVHVQDGDNVFWSNDMFGYGVSDPVLIPVAGDSASWSTEIRVYNGTDHAVPIDPEYCSFIGSWFPCNTPVTRIPAHSSMLLTGRGKYGWDILHPPLQDTDSVHFSIHVRDLGHPDQPAIEVPVLHRSDLLTASMVLPGVPTSDRFRSNLRVFSGAGLVTVTLFDSTTGVPVDVRSVQRYFPTDVSTFGLVNFRDLFEPAQVRAHERVDVVIETSDPDLHWALLTLTDNATQQVTTFTPQ